MAAGDSRVLVVGAGPTGLTAAIELARQSRPVRIVDRDQGPTPLSKAVGISAHSLDILEPSGVTERLLAEGIRIRRLHIRFEGTELGRLELARLPHRFNFLLALPQSRTETLMAEVLAGLGVQVEWRTAFTGLAGTDAAATATLTTPAGREAAGYRYVFGADGLESAVRQAAGLAFEGRTHARRWSIADAEIADWPYEAEAAHVFLHRGGDVGFVIPIGEARYRAVSNTPDALRRVPGRYRVQRLLRADTFHLPVRQAESYQRGRVFVGGDAAHVHSPVGARGMNLGIEDAAAFATRLVSGALDGYSAERRPIGRRWIAFSEGVLAAAQARRRLAVAARNLVIRIVGRVPQVQRPMLMRVAGLVE